MLPDVLLVIRQITQALDQLNIAYLIGGSVASSTLGKYRYTNDIDFVIDLQTQFVGDLVAELRRQFYVDTDMMLEAVSHCSSFSVLHLDTMVKADMFIRPQNAWSNSAWNRRTLQMLGNSEQSVKVFVRTAEDMILQKLNWYKLGNEVSERQWSDVIGMLEVQFAVLDFDYLQKWAQDLNLIELLLRAYGDAGISNK